RPGRRARHPGRRVPPRHVPRRRGRGEGARGGDGPLPEGPPAAQVLRASRRRPGERPPARRPHRVPARRARRAPAHAHRGRRRVAARVPEPALRPALRALALDRAPPARARVPVGAAARARGGVACRATEVQPLMKLPIYFKQLELGPMQNYVYLLGDPNTHEAAVVDAAWDIDAIVRTAEADGYRITKDLVTHFHPDHLGGNL